MKMARFSAMRFLHRTMTILLGRAWTVQIGQAGKRRDTENVTEYKGRKLGTACAMQWLNSREAAVHTQSGALAVLHRNNNHQGETRWL